jgi:hypothetical protein
MAYMAAMSDAGGGRRDRSQESERQDFGMVRCATKSKTCTICMSKIGRITTGVAIGDVIRTLRWLL